MNRHELETYIANLTVAIETVTNLSKKLAEVGKDTTTLIHTIAHLIITREEAKTELETINGNL